MFLSAKTPLVAIDIGSHSVKVAQLAKSGEDYELLSFGMMPLESETLVDGIIKKEDVVVDAIGKLLKAEKIQVKYCVASVSGEAVIVKKINVPMKSHAELSQSINQEAEQYIPFDIDDVSVDFQILGRSKKPVEALGDGQNEPDKSDMMEILLVAVQKELIDNRVNVLMDCGLKPVIVDLDVFALVNALAISRDLNHTGTTALIDLGASFTHMNIISDGLTAFTRDIPMGGLLCTQKLMSEFGVLYPEAEAFKQGKIPESVTKESVVQVIGDAFVKLAEEIRKSLEFFNTTSTNKVGRIFISGGGALVPGANHLFQDKLGVPVELLNPCIKVNPKKFDREFVSQICPIAAVAIGLATRKFDYK
ncbi:MAG: hypothetical protein A3K09_07980 [Nitrospinae bacterium RIFCSPLOWO2_12_FULL_47_7]|nr:MAG: hypothetical protein A3K09_07980 [Nitrospinae bacterium RIFCSPLOWO2_12_FULL_47_7]